MCWTAEACIKKAVSGRNAITPGIVKEKPSTLQYATKVFKIYHVGAIAEADAEPTVHVGHVGAPSIVTGCAVQPARVVVVASEAVPAFLHAESGGGPVCQNVFEGPGGTSSHARPVHQVDQVRRRGAAANAVRSVGSVSKARAARAASSAHVSERADEPGVRALVAHFAVRAVLKDSVVVAGRDALTSVPVF